MMDELVLQTESTLCELQDSLPKLQHRPFLCDKILIQMCKLDESIGALKLSNELYKGDSPSVELRGQDLIQEQEDKDVHHGTTRGAFLCKKSIDALDTHQEDHIKDIKAMESILPNIENGHAKVLLLAIKMELEALARKSQVVEITTVTM